MLMRANTALAVLLSALSLWFSEPRRSRKSHQISLLLAMLVGLVAVAVLLEYSTHLSLGVDFPTTVARGLQSQNPSRMAPQTAAALALLAAVMILARARKRITVLVADVFLSLLCLVVLILVSGDLFGALRMLGFAPNDRPSPQALVALALLTFVAFTRRAEHGFFSILLGTGIGSRTARIATPLVLLLPFVREIARIHAIRAGLMPAEYASATATSLTVMLAFALMLVMAWRINGLEREVHDLSLRDELTGLYNRRGFLVLAEHALRLAQRSHIPFSVLFIDVDNLKQINDLLGHTAGSAFLSETAELLKATFRETDVIGRIGGDEFVVAGQFSQMAISLAAQRLQKAAEYRNSERDSQRALNFSVGLVTTEGRHESLEELLTQADKAMYREKHRKKLVFG
jgi:diguanylate cyclase (GGDEF)-like protein